MVNRSFLKKTSPSPPPTPKTPPPAPAPARSAPTTVASSPPSPSLPPPAKDGSVGSTTGPVPVEMKRGNVTKRHAPSKSNVGVVKTKRNICFDNAVRAEVMVALLIGIVVAATLPPVARHESRAWVCAYILCMSITMVVVYRMIAKWFNVTIGSCVSMVGMWLLWLLHGAIFNTIESDTTRKVGALQSAALVCVAVYSMLPSLQPHTWLLFYIDVFIALALPHSDGIYAHNDWALAITKVYGFAVLFFVSDVVTAAMVDRWHYEQYAKNRDIVAPPERFAMRTTRAIMQSVWVLYATRYFLWLVIPQAALLWYLVLNNRTMVGKTAMILLPRRWDPKPRLPLRVPRVK